MKTTMQKMTLTAALVAALSATAPAQAEDLQGAGLYVPYQMLSARVRHEIATDFERSNSELGAQIRQEMKDAAAASASTADAREQLEPKDRSGQFWM